MGWAVAVAVGWIIELCGRVESVQAEPILAFPVSAMQSADRTRLFTKLK